MKKRNSDILIEKFEKYLDGDEKTDKTITTYLNIVNFFARFIEEAYDIDDFISLNKTHLTEFKKHLQKDKKFKISTVNLYITTINIFLKFIGKEELNLKHLKESKVKTLEKILTTNEVEKMLGKAIETGKHEVFLMIYIFVTIGIRVSELKFLTYEALKNKELNFYSKGKYRKIFLPDMLCDEIIEYCNDCKIEAGPIFRKKNGDKAYHESTIWRKIKFLAIEAGVDKNKGFPHNLRHFFALNYLENNNNNIAKLSEELGHSSIETTKIYLNYTCEERRIGIENVVIYYCKAFKILQKSSEKYANVS